MNRNFPTPTNAIRVWSGFKKADLDPKEFLKTLGDTFIPGTLYMLRSLGISAYVPAGLVNQNPVFPDELALIIYRSQDAYKGITRDSLRGRVHRASHAGFFDMTKSKASFPVFWKSKNHSDETYYLIEKDLDWQHGTVFLCLFRSVSPNQQDIFKNTFKSKFETIKSIASEIGLDQIIFQIRDDFASMWCFISKANINQEFLTTISESLAKKINDNILCSDIILKSESLAVYEEYPDTLNFSSHRLINYKFLRVANIDIF